MKEKEFGLLYVDDETMSLKYFREIFEPIAPVFTADNTRRGFEVFKENEDRIGVVLSDQKMPEETGIEFLFRVRDYNPAPLRILVTAYTDLNTAVAMLNDGLLYSYLSKPWDPGDLENRLVRALEHFAASRSPSAGGAPSGSGELSPECHRQMTGALASFRDFLDLIPAKFEEETGHPPRDEAFWIQSRTELRERLDRLMDSWGRLSPDAGDAAKTGRHGSPVTSGKTTD